MLKLKIILRSILRRLGVSKMLVQFFYPNGYEKSFDDAMFGAIKLGDIIWDVGANVGYYTVKFAEATGEGGAVHGFEPIPETFDMLKKTTIGHGNITLSCFALGRIDNNLPITNDTNLGSPTNKILVGDGRSSDQNTISIKVRSGDSLVNSGELEIPNFIKLDVEGHEKDAVSGMTDLFKDQKLRVVAIEIHFALLEERGLRDAPSDIVADLRRNNFNVHWTDPSHIIAIRE